MSEPIMLTERERSVFQHLARTLGRGKTGDDVIVGNALLHFLDADFQARHAESASPPRAPGASAHPNGDSMSPPRQTSRAVPVGVESGPGQPIADIAASLRVLARHVEWGPASDAMDEAAAEITRLREQVESLKTTVAVAEFKAGQDLRALNEANERADTERRAGIEAAAQYHDAIAKHCPLDYTSDRPTGEANQSYAAAIRALADKPAVDPLLAGLRYMQDELASNWELPTLANWLDREIAQRTGGEQT